MVIYYILYSRPPDLRLGHDMYDNITLRCLYVKMADLVLAQVMDDGIGTTLLTPAEGKPRDRLCPFTRSGNWVSLIVPLPHCPYETCTTMAGESVRHRSDGVLVGSGTRSSSPLLSSKSTMPPDDPGPPRSLLCCLGAETTDFTRPPGRGPKLILSVSRHDAISASLTEPKKKKKKERKNNYNMRQALRVKMVVG